MLAGLMQQSQETNVASDNTDVIMSHIETAVNLTSHQGSLDIELSSDIMEFLEAQGVRPSDVLSQRIVDVPEFDDSLPLTHYFISTSHNTYLLGLQIFGKASATGYTHVLSHHCRCIEIDVWPPMKDSAGQPVVTHGHTFSQHIPFYDVCVAIGNAVQPDAWPVMVSLECHLDISDQDKIVKIMKDVWQEKLIERPVKGREGSDVAPKDLRGKIVLMVEYYPPQSVHEAEVEALETEPETVEGNSSVHKQVQIGPALAALGIYALSVKPRKNWLTNDTPESSHILYNLSESTIGKLFSTSLKPLISNSLIYMRRVYPNFMRIFSSNLVPLDHWRSGTQVAALNWQRYDKGVQINEAMFVGSGGWVPKPNHLLRDDSNGGVTYTNLICEIVSGCNIPVKGANTKAYIRAELFLASGDTNVESQTTGSSSPSASKGDYTWKKKINWEFTDDDMAFIRISVYCSEFGKDERLGTFCARVEYLRPGWKLIRLFDKKGKHNGGLLLVQFTIKKMAQSRGNDIDEN